MQGSVCFSGTLVYEYAFVYECLGYGYECLSVCMCLFGYMPVGAFLHMYNIQIRQLHLSLMCLLCIDPKVYFFFVQVLLTDTNTQFVEQTIAIMKNLLDNHTEGSSEHLGQASIETMMLNLVR